MCSIHPGVHRHLLFCEKLAGACGQAEAVDALGYIPIGPARHRIIHMTQVSEFMYANF